MAQLYQIYKCQGCSNVVEIVGAGAGELVCCGKPMKLMPEKIEEEGKEKHVPVIEQDKKKVRVMVGSVPHPMEEDHHIEWIEIVADGKVYRKHLKVSDRSIADFLIKATSISARTFCNLHGLWKSV